MHRLLSVALLGSVTLVGLYGNAFAGVAPAVPEPATLALLAVGFGGMAVVKYFRHK